MTDRVRHETDDAEVEYESDSTILKVAVYAALVLLLFILVVIFV